MEVCSFYNNYYYFLLWCSSLLFLACNAACQLPDSFQTWFCVTQLHIWLSVVRLRAEGEVGKDVSRMVVEHFVNDLELKISNRGVRTREAMKELMAQYHGLSLAYDEGIYSDDTVLAGALWRYFPVFFCFVFFSP